MFNHKQRHEFKIKHLIWNNLIKYTKVVGERVLKFVNINTYLAKALLKGFSIKLEVIRTPSVGQMKIVWNWKRQCIYII